jgi:hypothetical protein
MVVMDGKLPGLGVASGSSGRFPSAEQRDQEQHREDDEKNLGDRGMIASV